MPSLNGIYDCANALGVFIRSNPRAITDPNKPFSAILKQSSSPPIRPLWIAVISLGILKFTLLQEVFFNYDDPGISISLEEYFKNQRHWLAVTPVVESPLYASRPNQPPGFSISQRRRLDLVAESPRHGVPGWSANGPLLVLLHLAIKSTYPILVRLVTARPSSCLPVPARSPW